MTGHDDLPPLLAEIAEVAGLPAALKLAREKGGVECYIPARVSDDHWLVRCVGREAADKISAHFSAAIDDDRRKSRHGVKILLPLGQTGSRADARRRAIEALDQGASLADAARRSGLHQRTVQNLRAKMQDNRQGSLF